ncbi:hypothetical protein BDA99DRAFT_201257 [Phascolomyces articulosus]|uniref:F-box domain-containing protein n=1 Tax=Phascolomyces articulosus TaxID=60185 RepID=A0AAD5K2M1_9FUNG|nr:hypothetical protein BDA99DRAFT_201257 [Phascolomyces articulosus]
MMNVQTLVNHWNAYKVNSFDVSTIHRAWHAYKNNNFQESIHCATIGVNDQIDNLAVSLYIRASAQGMAGDYDSAIMDAKLMIKLMPSAGHLLLGNLYSLQCHYTKAMKAYQRGLSQYLTASDEHCHQDQEDVYKVLLEQGYKYTQTKVNQRMDIIRMMPIEILDHIVMDYLTLMDRMTLLQVCKSWRNLASSFPRWWSFINNDTDIIAEDVFFLGCHVDDHILNMNINVTRYDNFNKIFTQMKHGKYHALKRLGIKCKYHNNLRFSF